MPRITSYTASTAVQGKPSLADTDVFAVDGTNGVRKINANKLGEALAEKTLHNAESIGTGYGKNGIYRGANLGSGATFAEASTPAQRTAIQNGTFDGLFIGDYWTVNGRVYYVADFNYWKRSGNTDFNVNHVVLIPDTSFGVDKMNTTNIVTGAYVGSHTYSDPSSVLNIARNTISNDFGSYLVSHKEHLSNAVTNGAQSAGAWFDSTVELMSELMVYGCHVRTAKYNNSYTPTVDKSQLSIFKLNPATINRRHAPHFWLRDVASSNSFAVLSSLGLAGSDPAGYNHDILPIFAVKGTTN